MSKGTNEVTACVICNQNELEVPSLSLCFCLDGPRKSYAGKQERMTLWLHEVAFLLLEGCPIPQSVLFSTLLLSPRITITEIPCLHVSPQHLARRAAEASLPLSGSPAPISPSLAPHPSCDCVSCKAKHCGLL